MQALKKAMRAMKTLKTEEGYESDADASTEEGDEGDISTEEGYESDASTGAGYESDASTEEGDSKPIPELVD